MSFLKISNSDYSNKELIESKMQGDKGRALNGISEEENSVAALLCDLSNRCLSESIDLRCFERLPKQDSEANLTRPGRKVFKAQKIKCNPVFRNVQCNHKKFLNMHYFLNHFLFHHPENRTVVKMYRCTVGKCAGKFDTFYRNTFDGHLLRVHHMKRVDKKKYSLKVMYKMGKGWFVCDPKTALTDPNVVWSWLKRRNEKAPKFL